MNTEHNGKSNKPSIFRVIGSVIAAAIGIQSETNRRRDFQEGASPAAYIVIDLIATILFIFTVIMVVKLVIDGVAGS